MGQCSPITSVILTLRGVPASLYDNIHHLPEQCELHLSLAVKSGMSIGKAVRKELLCL